jgi:hypothetical protein
VFCEVHFAVGFAADKASYAPRNPPDAAALGNRKVVEVYGDGLLDDRNRVICCARALLCD